MERTGIFEFLGLPLELRHSIYRLHLSNECQVSYQIWDDNGEETTLQKPANKPLLGVNILRVCRQIYDEALTFAHTSCKWAMGCAAETSDEFAIDCAERLACIPCDTAERIQWLGLDTMINLWSPTNIVTSIAMGDLTKMKSLRTIQLNLALESNPHPSPRWLDRCVATYRNSSLLIGLVCQILSQIPAQVQEVVWMSAIWDAGVSGTEGESDTHLLYIAQKYSAIRSCGCMIDQTRADSAYTESFSRI